METSRLLAGYVLYRLWLADLQARLDDDESGEGVISAAIAVLIMALLGAVLWGMFKGYFNTMDARVGEQINQIGR